MSEEQSLYDRMIALEGHIRGYSAQTNIRLVVDLVELIFRDINENLGSKLSAEQKAVLASILSNAKTRGVAAAERYLEKRPDVKALNLTFRMISETLYPIIRSLKSMADDSILLDTDSIFWTSGISTTWGDFEQDTELRDFSELMPKGKLTPDSKEDDQDITFD